MREDFVKLLWKLLYTVKISYSRRFCKITANMKINNNGEMKRLDDENEKAS